MGAEHAAHDSIRRGPRADLLRHVAYQVGERADDAITLVAVIPPQPGWPVPSSFGSNMSGPL